MVYVQADKWSGHTGKPVRAQCVALARQCLSMVISLCGGLPNVVIEEGECCAKDVTALLDQRLCNRKLVIGKTHWQASATQDRESRYLFRLSC